MNCFPLLEPQLLLVFLDMFLSVHYPLSLPPPSGVKCYIYLLFGFTFHLVSRMFSSHISSSTDSSPRSTFLFTSIFELLSRFWQSAESQDYLVNKWFQLSKEQQRQEEFHGRAEMNQQPREVGEGFLKKLMSEGQRMRGNWQKKVAETDLGRAFTACS